MIPILTVAILASCAFFYVATVKVGPESYKSKFASS